MDQRNHLKKIPFILVTGFLGSGKTSLLTEILRTYSDRLTIAIVQNEFAPGHVDGVTLRQTGKPFSLLEINNGSVFCACLLGDFISQLIPFIDRYQPDILFLEATGLADPIALGQVLQTPALSDRIFLAGAWCLVDALNFDRTLQSVSRSRHQIRIADLVWINKSDLVTSTESVRNKILEINPLTHILETSFGAVDKIDLFNYLEALSPFTNTENERSQNPEKIQYNPPPLKSCVVRSTRYFDESRIRNFLADQSQYLTRIKGYLRLSETRTLAIQTTYTDVSVNVLDNYEGPSEVIALGPDLVNRDFSKQLLALQIP